MTSSQCCVPYICISFGLILSDIARLLSILLTHLPIHYSYLPSNPLFYLLLFPLIQLYITEYHRITVRNSYIGIPIRCVAYLLPTSYWHLMFITYWIGWWILLLSCGACPYRTTACVVVGNLRCLKDWHISCSGHINLDLTIIPPPFLPVLLPRGKRGHTHLHTNIHTLLQWLYLWQLSIRD